MANIHIDWLTDIYDSCEMCGTSYAEGAFVYVNHVLALDLHPVAHCTGGAHYDEREVYDRILRHLGHTVEHA